MAELTLLQIFPGAEVVVVVKDPATGMAIWCRGRVSEESKIVDLHPEQTSMFAAEQGPIRMVPTESLELRLTAGMQTFTMGWPTQEQLAKPIPVEFDPTYFHTEEKKP